MLFFEYIARVDVMECGRRGERDIFEAVVRNHLPKCRNVDISHTDVLQGEISDGLRVC